MRILPMPHAEPSAPEPNRTYLYADSLTIYILSSDGSEVQYEVNVDDIDSPVECLACFAHLATRTFVNAAVLDQVQERISDAWELTHRSRNPKILEKKLYDSW